MDVIVWCIEHTLSEFSAKNMIQQFNPLTVARASLVMAIVEISSVAEGVRTFYQACYKLEGDLCVIMRALSVFRRMELYIENGYRTPRIKNSVDIAIPLLQSIELDHVVQVEAENTIVTVSSGKVTDMQTELTRLNGSKKEVQGETSSRGRIRVRTEHNQDNGQLDETLEQIVEARVKHKIFKATEKEANDSAEKVIATYKERKQKFPHLTKSPMMEHGNNILLPVGNYYNSQFTYEYGDCYQMKEILEAAHIFEPIFLSKNQLLTL